MRLDNTIAAVAENFLPLPSPIFYTFEGMKFLKSTAARILLVFLLFFTWFWFSLPSKLFTEPTSTVIEDREGNLLGARIADDGQWRFPHTEEVPEKFATAITQFEDRGFYNHLGFSPSAFARATKQNIEQGKIVSGGSTITMQVIRLSRKGKSRTFLEKIVEIILAIRLELSHSKKEILALYASHAPFGGNVVGLDAASWRYFGRSSDKLSWADMAMLAVLPNSPKLIYPGKNEQKLLAKRNRLLNRLLEIGAIDALTCELAKKENLAQKPLPIPRLAPHLLTEIGLGKQKGESVRTTLNGDLQRQVNAIVEKHHQQLKGNGVFNAAALVLDVETGNALAYVGNTDNAGEEFGSDVNIITAPRSTGSILKPILYAALLDGGEILPATLVADIPTQISGYAPQNFNLTYDGAVPANKALARSLNIPAVRMLQQYRYERLYDKLKKMGMHTLSQPADHYGLSLILGGAEGTLWDIAGMYASMGRTLNHFQSYSSQYNASDYHAPNFIYPKASKEERKQLGDASLLDAGALWLTFEALLDVTRPDDEASWKLFSSSKKIAWKTGTSFGSRDAWAIGMNAKYVVAVWVGNASGEGRPGLTGLSAAAPVLFDIFSVLHSNQWFEQPYDDMVQISVCRQSGHRAAANCSPVDSVWVQANGLKTSPCPYHRLVHLDATEHYQVTSNCESVNNMKHLSWFVLPPVQEWYYKSKDVHYKVLPPFRKDCISAATGKNMELIYPQQAAEIYVPYELDGKLGKTIFEVAHRKPGTTIFWHLDEVFISSTTGIHQLALAPPAGKHVLTVVDENGEVLTKTFRIIAK